MFDFIEGYNLSSCHWKYKHNILTLGCINRNKICNSCSNIISKGNYAVIISESFSSLSYGIYHINCILNNKNDVYLHLNEILEDKTNSEIVKRIIACNI
jgi:hypothetical protein